jgi:hypothetical protein
MNCSCDICVNACKTSPCLPTPDEARALKRAGYGDRLSRYRYVAGGPVIAKGPAIVGKEGGSALLSDSGPCTFLQDGLCEIHHMKPYEGREWWHGTSWKRVRMTVLESWAKGKSA